MTKPLKIVLLGDPGTGKTNLLSRLTKNHFNPKYKPSTGVMLSAYDIHAASQTMEADLWDFAGGERYRYLINSRLGDADGILLVYDVSNPATFEHLGTWLTHIRQAASPKTIIKLVGNKNDRQRSVSRKKAEQFAVNNHLSYIETSALNDHHVYLAFESMAQEINVATHSLSEPSTGSFGQKDPKASSDADEQQEEPFQVVLIDIEQARSRNIVCVQKPLDEANFIAISYRRGDFHEHVVDTKLGYVASLTSFELHNFYTLCFNILNEPDLKSTKYVWVDAICVDQNNDARRKATIYQMASIYQRATYILAVPDLHMEYLNHQMLGELESDIRKVKEFIYYLLHKKTDQLEQITEQWFDEMNIPKGMARKQLTRRLSEKCFADYLNVYNEQDPDSPCLSPCEHNCYAKFPQGSYDTYKVDCHNIPKAMLDHLQYSINECHNHSTNTTIAYKNSDCALCSLQMDMCKHQKKSLDKNETIPESDHKWLASVVREIRYDKYRVLVTDRIRAIAKVLRYLEYLINEWSSRVWGIGEYNIAKTKKSCKLKFWFLSLSASLEDIGKLGFFVFDFDKMNEYDLLDYCSLNQIIYIATINYDSFQETLRSQLNERPFVEMMLDSKASRNEDRFYAILPSSEYKSVLTSREVVSSWKIDTIVSVKLKLFELMNTKDKMELLYRMTCSHANLECTFPAFANTNMVKSSLRPIKERDEENRPCNFDLNNNATLRLVPPMKNGHHFHTLNLSPKMYYVIHPDEDSRAKTKFVDDNQRFWETLEVNYVDDDLVYAMIPMYMHNIDTSYLSELIVLFGNFKKNKWMLCQVFTASDIIKNFPVKEYDNSDGNISFDIY